MRFTSLFLMFFLVFFIFFGCKKNNSDSDSGNGTCSDGILNQNETAVDCGGVCSVCQTCYDGIQNQGETGIDCGGPCNNTCPIKYPEFGTFGKNLLFMDTTVYLKVSVNSSTPYIYCMKCVIPEGAKVKVVLEKIDASNGVWWYNSSGNIWNVSPYKNIQDFTAVGPVIADVGIHFTGASAMEMRVYENDATTPSMVRGFLWR